MTGWQHVERAQVTPDSLVGVQLDDTWTWSKRDAIAYAISVGATPHQDLDYLYERHGPQVYDLFAALPLTSPWIMKLLTATGYEALFLSQFFRLRSRMPCEGKVKTCATVKSVWDSGRSAIIEVYSEIGNEEGLVASATSRLYAPGIGGFGGNPAPAGLRERWSAKTEPDDEITVETRPEQAAWFRIIGDYIERSADLTADVHVDPQAARRLGIEGPILPGICVLGIVGRLLGRIGRKLASVSAEYVGVAYPGQSLGVTLWDLDADEVMFLVSSLPDQRRILFGQARYNAD